MKKITNFSIIMILSVVVTCFTAFAAPPTNPFTDFFNITTDPPPTSTTIEDLPLVDLEKNPFLQEFLAVYEGDWVFIPYVKGEYFNVDVKRNSPFCNDDETECCGEFEVRSFDGNNTDVIIGGLFCLTSTYEIHLRDANETTDIQCIGVRGARMKNVLRIPGYAIDDPTVIECQTFRLVRPE